MQEVRFVAAPRLCLRWQRVRLPRIPDVAEGHRESGFTGVQSVEVADGALRLHSYVVSAIKLFTTDSDKLCDEVLNGGQSLFTLRDFQAINALNLSRD